jgi:hypothetical protein
MVAVEQVGVLKGGAEAPLAAGGAAAVVERDEQAPRIVLGECAAVLPVPVWAAARTSRPARISGIAEL